MRPGTDESFRGLKIDVETSSEKFAITDNCGGIPLDIATTYAFRFGPTRTPTQYATGQFGVGMKRALFKLGDRIKLSSATRTSKFTLDFSVKTWLALPESDWDFTLTRVRDRVRIPAAEVGTKIEVKDLHSTIARDLVDDEVLGQLRTELTERHMLSLHKGLVIRVNGQRLATPEPTLIDTPKLRPAQRTWSRNGAVNPVLVKLLCGVSDTPAREAGWSVFLNDRMVLLDDKSSLTGWGTKDGTRVPRFHNQYGNFKGYAFLSCATTERLPWDTTKTGLDIDSPLYREVLSQMVSLMEPVIRFLDDLDRERTRARETGQPGPLMKAFEVKERPLFAVIASMGDKARERLFKRPEATAPPAPPRTEQSIQFTKPKSEIQRMKRYFKVSSAGQAGAAAWQYVIEVEDP